MNEFLSVKNLNRLDESENNVESGEAWTMGCQSRYSNIQASRHPGIYRTIVLSLISKQALGSRSALPQFSECKG